VDDTAPYTKAKESPLLKSKEAVIVEVTLAPEPKEIKSNTPVPPTGEYK
jgi:hypothetical protein